MRKNNNNQQQQQPQQRSRWKNNVWWTMNGEAIGISLFCFDFPYFCRTQNFIFKVNGWYLLFVELPRAQLRSMGKQLNFSPDSIIPNLPFTFSFHLSESLLFVSECEFGQSKSEFPSEKILSKTHKQVQTHARDHCEWKHTTLLQIGPFF